MNFNTYLEELVKRGDITDALTVFLSKKPDAGTWRGMLALPPGSALEGILSAFKKETDIPLELPFFSFIHGISQLLLNRGVVLKGPVGTLTMEIWTIVLAPSGSGKTLAYEIVSKDAPVNFHFPEPASGAAFIQSLADEPTTHWTQDEIGQKLKQIEQPGPMADCKDYLLRAYGNDRIERKTKAGTITVERPVLGILGFNVGETFIKNMAVESLLDGFAQRFGYVWAEREADCDWQQYAIYNMERLGAACKSAWKSIENQTIHSEYVLHEDAEVAFRAAFALLGYQEGMHPSFFRRAMFRAFKYAVIYHVLLGKESNVIDATDIGWAARLCHLHLNDTGKMLRQKPEFQAAETLVDRVKKAQEKSESDGVELTPRVLQQRVRGVKSAEHARALLALTSTKH